MPLLEWDTSYNVGVESIDDEHKILVRMINEAFDASEAEDDTIIITKLVDDMRKYAEMHFATEENLMVAYDYPDRDIHMSRHDIFRDRTRKFDQASDTWTLSNTINLLKFLADWLNNHILKTDRELAHFMKAQDKR